MIHTYHQEADAQCRSCSWWSMSFHSGSPTQLTAHPSGPAGRWQPLTPSVVLQVRSPENRPGTDGPVLAAQPQQQHQPSVSRLQALQPLPLPRCSTRKKQHKSGHQVVSNNHQESQLDGSGSWAGRGIPRPAWRANSVPDTIPLGTGARHRTTGEHCCGDVSSSQSGLTELETSVGARGPG
uniref:Uncharacterized protein n=1 Tax=Pipistrellus kuhlii TaxID=59472 RepID=A0A7J8A8F7_PIPKU|nr:hypothetical protein mPipKuh1_008901 [Pipistrellus kuhlii]